MMSDGKYYAVARGRNPGVYYSWEECQRETKGWPNAVFKKFGVEKLAWDFVKQNCPNMKLSAGSSPVKTRVVDVEPSTSSNSSKVSLLERLQRLEHQIQESHENIMLELNSIKAECLSPPPKSSRKIAFIDLEDAPVPPSIALARFSAVKSEVNPPKKARLESLESTHNKFKVDADGYVEVYTDGACSKNGRDGSQAGIGVWFGDRHNLNISEPVKGRITNNCAEIEAATAAIEAAHGAGCIWDYNTLHHTNTPAPTRHTLDEMREERQTNIKNGFPALPRYKSGKYKILYRGGIKKLKLYTDSNFLICSITRWINKWQKNGWKTADGEPVKNKDELILLNNARMLLDVKFVHVKGHAGNYENEQADALARAGASKCPISKMC